MDAILKELSSPLWWLSVVVAGLLVNLASAYLKSPLDSVVSRFSSRWANRSQARRDASESRIATMQQDSELLMLSSMAELRHRIRGVFLLVIAFGFSAFAIEFAKLKQQQSVSSGLLLISSFIVTFAFLDIFRAIAIREEVAIASLRRHNDNVRHGKPK